MKLALAITLAGMNGLGSTADGRERPVDRLTALGMAIGPVEGRGTSQAARGDHAAMESFLCALGGDLIAFKFSNRASSKSEAELKLAIALGWKRWGLRLKVGQYERIAGCAIQEYAFDVCIPCSGKGKVAEVQGIDGRQPLVECGYCRGTGKTRYTDEERTESMGEAFEKAIGWAHSLISQSESMAVRAVKERLERW